MPVIGPPRTVRIRRHPSSVIGMSVVPESTPAWASPGGVGSGVSSAASVDRVSAIHWVSRSNSITVSRRCRSRATHCPTWRSAIAARNRGPGSGRPNSTAWASCSVVPVAWKQNAIRICSSRAIMSARSRADWESSSR